MAIDSQPVQRKKVPCAILTVIEAEGSVPRGVGSKMVVNQQGESAGSVGGGGVEKNCIEEALSAIKNGQCKTLRFSLEGDDWKKEENRILKGACGGVVTVFIEPLVLSKEVVIFGAGHIAQAMGKYCDILNLPYRVYDDRSEFATKEKFPNAAELVVRPFRALSENIQLSEHSYCLIVTHGHESDGECLERLTQNPRVPYIGMIGSPHKIRILINNLKQKGINVDSRLYGPVGLGLGKNTPEEIALSIIAEIYLLMENGKAEHMRVDWTSEENLKSK